MNAEQLIWPMLAQVVLTTASYFRLAIGKARAVQTGGVDLKRTALHHEAWPDAVLKISNNIRNQFEVPVLFYVLVLILIVLNQVSDAAIFFAWFFVASRIAHAYVHQGSNRVKIRLRLFLLGWVGIAGLLFLTIGAALG